MMVALNSQSTKAKPYFLKMVLIILFSCPYTPKQNKHAEHKYHHITKTGLAMLFNAGAPKSLRVDGFSPGVYIINRLPSHVLDNKSPFELLFYNSAKFSCVSYLWMSSISLFKELVGS